MFEKIKGLFKKKCPHKNKKEYVKEIQPGQLITISGQTVYLVCEDCGEIVSEYFEEYN